MLLPLRSVLRREELPQRRAHCSSDTTKTFEHLFGGDRLSSIGLSDRFQEFRLKFRRNFKGFVRFASKNRDDGTFGQGIPFHDDLSAAPVGPPDRPEVRRYAGRIGRKP